MEQRQSQRGSGVDRRKKHLWCYLTIVEMLGIQHEEGTLSSRVSFNTSPHPTPSALMGITFCGAKRTSSVPMTDRSGKEFGMLIPKKLQRLVFGANCA